MRAVHQFQQQSHQCQSNAHSRRRRRPFAKRSFASTCQPCHHICLQVVNQLPLSLQSGNGDFQLNAGDLNALAAAASFNNGPSALSSPWMNSSGLHGMINSKYCFGPCSGLVMRPSFCSSDLDAQSKQQQQRQQGNYVKLEPNSPAGGAADSGPAAMRPVHTRFEIQKNLLFFQPFASQGSAVNGGPNDEPPFSGDLAMLGRSPPKRARVEAVADWRAQQMT